MVSAKRQALAMADQEADHDLVGNKQTNNNHLNFKGGEVPRDTKEKEDKDGKYSWC